MLCRQHASVWEEAPQTAFILAAQHPILQSSTKSRGWMGAPDIRALCGQHMSLQRQAGALPRCSLPRDTRTELWHLASRQRVSQEHRIRALLLPSNNNQ